MAEFVFARTPRRGDPDAALVVQKNLEEFTSAALHPIIWYAPERPRKDDPLKHLVVDRNLQAAVFDVLKEENLPFFFPYTVRRRDPNAALVLQKNLEALVTAL